MCTPVVGGLALEGIDVARETVIQGTVESAGSPVSGAFARLLDASGEFTAEVVTSASGGFRFFAAPGRWTVRALSVAGAGQTAVDAVGGDVSETIVTI